MSISDKAISEIMMDAEDEIEMNGTYDINGDDLRAILVRLEAAEAFAEVRVKAVSIDGLFSRLSPDWDLYNAWRKSAGKCEG